MSSWTKEPWQMETNCSLAGRIGVFMSQTDYDRARACVNALAGIEDPAALKAENAQLREANAKLRDKLELYRQCYLLVSELGADCRPDQSVVQCADDYIYQLEGFREQAKKLAAENAKLLKALEAILPGYTDEYCGTGVGDELIALATKAIEQSKATKGGGGGE